MIAWCRIDSLPPLEFYAHAEAAVTTDLTFRRLINIGAIHQQLSVGGGGENANVSVTLDNGDGALTEFFSDPPLRTQAQILTADGPLFTGIVAACDMGTTLTIALESGGVLPLSDRLPLRDTTVWGRYKDKRALPWVYGRRQVEPIQYDNEGYLFVVADHPCQAVEEITRDDLPSTAFDFYNTVDDTGHPVAIIELAAPLSEGEQLRADVRGKVHPSTGQLLTAPAYVLWDLLANMVGLPITIAALDSFRAETAQWSISGVIDDQTRTVRAQVDEICNSVGAVWSAAMPDFARVYPAIDPQMAIPSVQFDRLTASNVSSTVDQSDIVTVLRVLYDYVEGAPRRAVEFEAPESIRRFGRIDREIDAKWIQSPRHAAELAARLLQYRARPVWSIKWQADLSRNIPPGVDVTLDHPLSPITPSTNMIVMSPELDLSSGNLNIVAQAPIGPVPNVVMTKLSTAFEPVLTTGATVVYNSGHATFTITGDNGQPLPSAVVTLDGTDTRITDPQGKVQFATARGSHTLYIEATNYEPMEIQVVI